MNKNINKYYGLSTDNKPTTVKDGSIYIELDTADVYVIYKGTWYKQKKQGGTDTMDATATASDILKDKTAYARGEKLTGTLELDLPYRELEFIMSSGTQYIDTGLKSSSSLKIECDFQILDTTVQRNYIWGVMDGTADRLQFSYSFFNNVYGFGDSYNTPANSNPTLDKHHIVMDNGVFTLDNEVIQTIIPNTFLSETYNLCLFAINNTGTVGTYATIKLYGMKIYDNNVLVRDFIPCVRKLDDVVCLYDKVSGEFFENEGTGVFLVSEYNAKMKDNLSNTNSTIISLIEEIPVINCANITSLSSMFLNFKSIKYIELINTSNITHLTNAFSICSSLQNIKPFDCSSVQFFSNAFLSCDNLTNEGLNNILSICLGATSYTGTKTLQYIGLSSTQATTCTTLSNWSACQSAGWTTGY